MHEANAAPSFPHRSLTTTTSASSAAPSRVQTPHNVPNAALVGALAAFGGTAGKKSAVIEGKGGLVVKHNTGSLRRLRSEDGERLRVKSEERRPRTPEEVNRATSFAAATVAARRHQEDLKEREVVVLPIRDRSLREGEDSIHAKPRRPPHRTSAKEMDGGSEDRWGEGPTDSTSIAPTTSLVKMFEQQANNAGPRKTSTPPIIRQASLVNGKGPPIVAPKPQRTVSMQAVSPELGRGELLEERPRIPKHTPNGKIERIIVPRSISGQSTPKITSVEKLKIPSLEKPSIPPPRRTTTRTSSSQPAISLHHQRIPAQTPPSHSKPAPRPKNISHSPTLRPTQPSNPRRPSPAPYKDEYLKTLSPHITGDSLANAIVGANRAIKSASPPKNPRSKTPPPPPPSRRKHDIFHRARSLSPQKKHTGRLLATLRVDEEEEKRGEHKKHHFRQPNKHHEGTRERWQDVVTEAERKRYEGVWAANKGLYVPSKPDGVLDLVVRELWCRSRLPPERLGKIWDLVTLDENGQGKGGRVLGKEQFVVGMWLVDQVLKGRNLPHSVNASVWASVRLRGVKVRLEGRGEDGRKLERGEW